MLKLPERRWSSPGSFMKDVNAKDGGISIGLNYWQIQRQKGIKEPENGDAILIRASADSKNNVVFAEGKYNGPKIDYRGLPSYPESILVDNISWLKDGFHYQGKKIMRLVEQDVDLILSPWDDD